MFAVIDPVLEENAGRFAATPAAELCQKFGIVSIIGDNLAAEQITTTIREHKINLAIVSGWRQVISTQFLSALGGCVLNIHNAVLPKHRGAGGFSWQVLMGEERVGATIHQMAAQIDTGPVLFSESEPIKDVPIYPLTLMAAYYQLLGKRALPRLIKMIRDESTIVMRVQNENEASYFPMLSTPRNGLLNLSWQASEVVRFIRAFSYPYPGASVRYHGEIYRICEADAHQSRSLVHPLQYGLISNIAPSGVDVFVGGGIVRFRRIIDEAGNDINPTRFRTGNRFYNSTADLESALSYRHAHGKS